MSEASAHNRASDISINNSSKKGMSTEVGQRCCIGAENEANEAIFYCLSKLKDRFRVERHYVEVGGHLYFLHRWIITIRDINVDITEANKMPFSCENHIVNYYVLGSLAQYTVS